jgi:hypothetical protein
LQTATISENINQGVRMPTKIQVTSLDPFVDFSESCDPVSVNAQGCAMHSAKRIAVGTPVLLRIQTGTEATGQVAFCKASSSGDKLWGLGVVLDKLEECRLSSCPKDHATGDDDADVLLDDKGIDGGVAPPESGCIPDVISVEADTMRVEIREQVRKETDAILTDARAKLEEQLQAQRKNTAFAEALLQDAADVRSFTAIQQSLPETLDRKVTDGIEDALQQIGVRMDTLMLRAQSESEQLQEQIRGVGDEMNRQARQSVLVELEKVQHQLYEDANKYFEEKRQQIADAILSMGQVSDQIYSTLLQRLERDFQGKQEIVGSSQNAITIEVERLQAEVGNIDDRIAKLHELPTQLAANISGRLDQTVSETITQARTSMEHLLGEIRDDQLGLARAEVKSMLTTVSTRADSLIKEELCSFGNMLVREHDETQIEIAAVRQEKKEMQLWLVQQGQDFRKAIEDALFDARNQGWKGVQEALDMIQDPVAKLTCEAKKKIEEAAARQSAEIDEHIRRLRDELAMLQEQAGSSIRASLQAISEKPDQCHATVPAASAK